MAGYGQHYSGAIGNGYRDSLGEHRPRSPLVEDPRRFAGDARRDDHVEGDPCCMYIENLSIRTTENDLFEACEHWGDIRHVKLVKDKLSGVPRYAFITFANARGAAAAVEGMHLSELNGRKVRVEAARGYRHGDPGADDYVYGKGIIAKRAPEALPPARMGPPADRYAQAPALADDYGGASRGGGGGAPYGSRPPPRRSGSRDRGGSGAYAAAGPPPRGRAPGGDPDDGWDEPDAMPRGAYKRQQEVYDRDDMRASAPPGYARGGPRDRPLYEPPARLGPAPPLRRVESREPLHEPGPRGERYAVGVDRRLGAPLAREERYPPAAEPLRDGFRDSGRGRDGPAAGYRGAPPLDPYDDRRLAARDYEAAALPVRDRPPSERRRSPPGRGSLAFGGRGGPPGGRGLGPPGGRGAERERSRERGVARVPDLRVRPDIPPLPMAKAPPGFIPATPGTADARIVFVGGINPKTTQERMIKAFTRFGKIDTVRMRPDRGFAFVNFSTEEAAIDAMRIMHGMEIDGRKVTVAPNASRDHPPATAERARSGGGGSYGPDRRESGRGGRRESRDPY